MESMLSSKKRPLSSQLPYDPGTPAGFAGASGGPPYAASQNSSGEQQLHVTQHHSGYASSVGPAPRMMQPSQIGPGAGSPFSPDNFAYGFATSDGMRRDFGKRMRGPGQSPHASTQHLHPHTAPNLPTSYVLSNSGGGQSAGHTTTPTTVSPNGGAPLSPMPPPSPPTATPIASPRESVAKFTKQTLESLNSLVAVRYPHIVVKLSTLN